AKKATDTIPIVFGTGADPVQVSLISLDRPNGNITGVTMLHTATAGKRLELLRELVPAANVFALLTHPRSAFADPETKALHEAARALGVELRVLNATNEREIDTAFAIMAKEHSGPLVISADNVFTDQLLDCPARESLCHSRNFCVSRVSCCG